MWKTVLVCEGVRGERAGVLTEGDDRAGVSSFEDFELVTSAKPGPGSSRTSSNSSAYNALALEIPELPSEALRLCGNLRGAKLSFKQRAERAWSAGVWARFVLEGKIAKPRPSSPCDVANTTYVVVRAKGALLGDCSEAGSLSHGFASKGEVRVYCLGLNIPYPEKVYQWS